MLSYGSFRSAFLQGCFLCPLFIFAGCSACLRVACFLFRACLAKRSKNKGTGVCRKQQNADAGAAATVSRRRSDAVSRRRPGLLTKQPFACNIRQNVRGRMENALPAARAENRLSTAGLCGGARISGWRRALRSLKNWAKLERLRKNFYALQ